MQAGNSVIIDNEKLRTEKGFSEEEIASIYKEGNTIENLINIAREKEINIALPESLREGLDNYNDMGLMQAIDNISAVISVMEVIKDNGYEFNRDKVMLYGHSHGAYLCYLCNAVAPNLFSLLIDNSAWLFPAYLEENRVLHYNNGNGVFSIEFEYLAKGLDFDREILYLPSLYKKFENQCPIVCYHGTDDYLISNEDKIELQEIIKEFHYHEVADKDVDNIVFKSTQHGLGADFLKLYDYTMETYDFKYLPRKRKENENVIYETKKNKYLVDYSKIIPILYIDKK